MHEYKTEIDIPVIVRYEYEPEQQGGERDERISPNVCIEGIYLTKIINEKEREIEITEFIDSQTLIYIEKDILDACEYNRKNPY